CMQALEFPWPF
nr:immunoglobulin light chain junction region [Macaca mulatta]